MTKLLSKIALAAAMAAAPLAAQAQAPAGAVLGVGVANLDKAVGDAAAYRTAQTQLQTQFKTQLDAYAAREQSAQAELQGLQNEIDTLQRSNAPAATIQQKVAAAQARQTALRNELNTLSTPFQRQFAFARQQVTEKLDSAVRAAMTAKRVGILLDPQAVAAASPANDITGDITTALNGSVKAVSITPPAGWQPGQPTTAAAPTGR